MAIGTLSQSATPCTFLGAGPPSNRFSAILRFKAGGKPQSRMATVNAGDPGLYVGGATINQAFSGQIPQPGDYQLIHQQALLGARTGHSVRATFASGAPVRLVQVMRGKNDPAKGPVGAGTVFLDLFAQGQAPHGVAENYAMAYVVPPNGHIIADAGDFLDAVSEAARNVVSSIATFNSAVSGAASGPYQGLDRITDLRTCLFSGGQFRHPDVTVGEVAACIFAALDSALAAAPSGLGLVEFESGVGEFAAVSPGRSAGSS